MEASRHIDAFVAVILTMNAVPIKQEIGRPSALSGEQIQLSSVAGNATQFS